jgi:hypothetical protein
MPEPDASPAQQPNAQQPGQGEYALLHDLTRWRELLARSSARNNPGLRSDQITAAVNRILFPLLLLRMAEDRQLVPAGTIAAAREFRTFPQVFNLLGPYAEALYADESPATLHLADPGTDLILEERDIQSLLHGLTSQERRYNFTVMTNAAVARVLTQYLARTIRRSAAHQAMVVDTHDTVVSGRTVLPPLPLIEYLVRQALAAAGRNRSARELLPLRVFDPACGSGTVLLSVYRHLMDTAGGPNLTFEERREILTNSVYGLDINRHAMAVTRMLLLLELCEGRIASTDAIDFSVTAQSVLRELRHTILCGNALVGPEIVHDESWMFCPARDRHTLNPFVYKDRFPEIVTGGGFDAVVSNPPEGSLEQREWIQQYFQRRYSVYHPQIDRSAYFLEKSLSLVRPGGIVSCVMSNRWLRGSNGSPLREVLNDRQIGEIVDLSAIPAGNPGAGLCLLRIHAVPPSHSFPAVIGNTAFIDEPAAYAALHFFPVDQHQLDRGGWTLRDTRTEQILSRVRRHSTPLEEVIMGEVHNGIHLQEDDPFVIDEPLAREWIRRDPRCKSLLRRLVKGPDIGHYHAGPGGKYLLLIPHGWTDSHQKARNKSWQWLKHRHPLIARYLQPFSDRLTARAGQEMRWWESGCDEFWHEPRKKILFDAQFTRLRFFPDDGWGIGDETSSAIPSAGLYLAGILNSRLMAFVFDHYARQSASDQKYFTWENIRHLPVYTPDFDRPEDYACHDRMEMLVRRMLELGKNCRAAKTDTEQVALQKKIHGADVKINALVYDLYGLTADEIAVVEAAVDI